MPRRGMGVEMYIVIVNMAKRRVMPRRGMGVEIRQVYFHARVNIVMPRRGMGVEMTNTAYTGFLSGHAPQGHGSRNPLPECLPPRPLCHAPQGHGSRNEVYKRNGTPIGVMPRRGMGVEILYCPSCGRKLCVMPRRGMGVEMERKVHMKTVLWSCPAGAWE